MVLPFTEGEMFQGHTAANGRFGWDASVECRLFAVLWSCCNKQIAQNMKLQVVGGKISPLASVWRFFPKVEKIHFHRGRDSVSRAHISNETDTVNQAV